MLRLDVRCIYMYVPINFIFYILGLIIPMKPGACDRQTFNFTSLLFKYLEKYDCKSTDFY